ncbi:ABC transporter ATP-binding protein [Streptomyces sulfonofaciens]|uniref:ABC transporter ATP-binding protein n=1 Tax=Streptomyces sulfonofaciens TaxID=68272 RepID=A0A919GHT7_9ACTN|nr:ABC transporter ATP-binding protein [Streptomyces sulfonofaciens]GHH84213.1 ABC transporter ATP-binding protein [Streptomyces sulfonofaciens]
MILQAERLEVRHGATRALRDVTCEVAEGQVLALIGANGAGKSTLLRALAGLDAVRSGVIRLFGEDITGRSAHAVARRGLSLVPEGRQLFADLTVRENLQMGCYRAPGDRAAARLRFERVFGLFPVLRDFAERRAGMLSGGQQQMVAVGRALMGEPRVLLLDEPSLGLAPAYVGQILDVVRELADTGTAVVLAEQNAAAALRTADQGIVLSNGTVTHRAPAADLLADDDVSRHYLGVGGADDGAAPSPARVLPEGLRELRI